MKKLILLVSILLLSACANTSPVVSPSSSGTTTSTTTEKKIEAPTFGSGAKKIEYYADFQCPACIHVSKTVLPVLESFAASGKLQITYKQFPLTTIHKNAYRDSLAAICAHEQGQYAPYKKALYALEESKKGATVSDEDRISALQGITIDTEQFAQCLKNDTYKARVDQDIADGDALRVNATPTIVLDGVKLDMGLFQSMEMFANYMSGYVNR